MWFASTRPVYQYAEMLIYLYTYPRLLEVISGFSHFHVSDLLQSQFVSLLSRLSSLPSYLCSRLQMSVLWLCDMVVMYIYRM